jgi:aminoglycoside phosphotransferase (APT) family kinase protein
MPFTAPPGTTIETEVTGSGLQTPVGHHALPIERVAAYLASVGLQLDRSREVRQFAGGLANLNFLIHVDGKPMVLRRPPGGELPKGAHDMGREFQILSHLWRALPFVPRGIHLCTQLDVLGVPFQLIEYRTGVVIRGVELPFPERAAELGEMLIVTLAQLHAVDPAAVGLEQLGRPAGFVGRAIEGWNQRGLQVVEGLSEQRWLQEIVTWLRTQKVAERRPSLLHCDFKLDNCILDPGTLQPNAVIDWDMGTRGDPLFDLATLLSYWTQADDPPCMQRLRQMPTALPGFPSRDEVVLRYARLTGHDVSDYPVFRVLALLKLGVVFLQLHQSWRSGAVGDERYADFRTLGAELLEYTHTLMRGHCA